MRLAKVFVKCIAEGLLVGPDHPLYCLQLLLSPFDGPCPPWLEGISQTLNYSHRVHLLALNSLCNWKGFLKSNALGGKVHEDQSRSKKVRHPQRVQISREEMHKENKEKGRGRSCQTQKSCILLNDAGTSALDTFRSLWEAPSWTSLICPKLPAYIVKYFLSGMWEPSMYIGGWDDDRRSENNSVLINCTWLHVPLAIIQLKIKCTLLA